MSSATFCGNTKCRKHIPVRSEAASRVECPHCGAVGTVERTPGTLYYTVRWTIDQESDQ